jgi:hypothetical protein
MLAVGRAHAIAAWGSSPDAMVRHHTLDPPAADRLSLVSLGAVLRRRPSHGLTAALVGEQLVPIVRGEQTDALLTLSRAARGEAVALR